jgi:uncharacterized protein
MRVCVASDGERLTLHPVSEWPAVLDVRASAPPGWRPTPLRQFILKMHQRCNLACGYCYVYELADQSWRHRPRRMSEALVSVVAGRIADHARAHDLDSVRIIFHGGEPLLSGPAPLVEALRKIRAAVPARTRVDSWVQTNGTMLDAKTLDALAELDIRVGVSLDGDAATHDAERRYPSGRGSFDDVARGLELLRQRPATFSGLLCVVNLAASPLATYDALLDFRPPALDFLLPHGNWTSPPPGRPDGALSPYADWLIEVFDRWYAAPVRETHIRLFDEIMHILLGGRSATEAVGLTPTSLVVIETDGTIEQSDALKSAYQGAAATGLHIVSSSFDEVLELPQMAATQLGLAALSDECRACIVGSVCGGGLYAHRYRAGHGFRNRSVYCEDLLTLITHIQARMAETLSALDTR